MSITSSKTKPILCVGASTWTTIFGASPLSGATTQTPPSDALRMGEGRSASAACAVVQLGGRAEFWGRVGNDANSCDAVASLVDAGLDCSSVRFIDGVRGSTSTVIIDRTGEPVVNTEHDSALPSDTSGLPSERIARGEFAAVLADGHWPEAAAVAFAAARAAGIPRILDADAGPADVLQELSAYASHVLYSASGLEARVGPGAVSAQLARAQRALPRARVGVTRGADGFYWAENGETKHAPAVDVAAIDTYAAGSVFRGAYAVALTEGMDSEAAAQFACIAASLKCSVFGGRLGAPDRETMERALAMTNALEPA